MTYNLETIYNNYLTNANFSIDTRTLSSGDIFIALRGQNFDGHNFVLNALRQGAKYAVCDSKISNINDSISSKIIYVHNTENFLRELALFLRKKYENSTHFVSITGSAGKTSMCNIVEKLLRNLDILTSKHYKNYNNHIGMPLCLINNMNYIDTPKICISEIGISYPNDMEVLASVSYPDTAIITNIGRAHIGNFESEEDLFREKMILAKYAKKNVILAENIYQRIMEEKNYLKYQEFLNNKNLYIFRNSLQPLYKDLPNKGNSIKTKNAVNIDLISISKILNDKDKGHLYQIKFRIGQKYYFYNHENGYMSLHANIVMSLGFLFYVVYENNDIFETTENLTSIVNSIHLPRNRGTIRKSKKYKNLLVVDNSYNANLLSIQNSIESLKIQYPGSQFSIILGSMKELGKFSEDEHRKLGYFLLLQSQFIENVILIGDEMGVVKSVLDTDRNILHTQQNSKIFKQSEALFFYPSIYEDSSNFNKKLFEDLKDLLNNEEEEKIFLIQGSRSMELNHIVDFLE